MAASGPSATLLTLYHSGLGDDPAWLPARKQINQGWTKGLKNLGSVLEEGPDLRITLRPMLGFILGEINQKIADELSLPVCEGMRLDSLVAGMGADRAGLQKDDLIVSLDGKPIAQFADLPGILAARQVGDWIEVEFYRGPKKHQLSLELSRRPMPNIPATPQELSETLGKVYAELDRILGEVLKGTTPAQEDFRPDLRTNGTSKKSSPISSTTSAKPKVGSMISSTARSVSLMVTPTICLPDSTPPSGLTPAPRNCSLSSNGPKLKRSN